MTSNQSDASPDTISVDDMRMLMRDEIFEVHKCAELRIREMADLTASYAAGQMTAEEATKAWYRHEDKWGEALPGVINAQGKTDEEIHQNLESTVGPHTALVRLRKQSIQHSGKSGSTPG